MNGNCLRRTGGGGGSFVKCSLFSGHMGRGSGSLRWRGTNGMFNSASLLAGDSNGRKNGGRVRDDAMGFFLFDDPADIVLDILEAGIYTLGEGQEARFVNHIRSFFVVSFLVADERGPNMGLTFNASLMEALDFVDLLEAVLEEKGEALVVAVSL